MNTRRIGFLLLPLFLAGILAAAGGADNQRRRRHRRSRNDSHKYQRILRHALGHHAQCKAYSLDGRRFAVVEQGDERLVALLTADYSDVEGYRGVTNSLVLIDLEGVIREIKVVESEDTPPYVRRVVRKGFLDQFKGLKPGVAPEVDAVTGATMTCDAIRDSLVETMKTFADMAQKLDLSGPEPRAKEESTTLEKIE